MRHSDVIPQTTREIEKPLFTLASPPAPLLPSLKPENAHRKTLILDLDETLVHSVTTPTKKAVLSLMFKVANKPNVVHVLFRPYAEEFLEKMAELYEIVIFTASQKYYADYVINKLDPKKHVVHRLYRQHCVISSKKFIKDLNSIGRDLKNVIIVDNSPAAYEWNSENAIPIESWIGKEEDNCLEKLLELLKDLAKVDDVRRFLVKPWEHGEYNYEKISEKIKSECKQFSPKSPKGRSKEVKETRNSAEEACRPKARSSVGLREEKIPKVEANVRSTVGGTETKPKRFSSIKHPHKSPGFNQFLKKCDPCHVVMKPNIIRFENKENVNGQNTPKICLKSTPFQPMKNVLKTEQKTSFGYNCLKGTNRMINIYYPKNVQERYSDIRETSFLKDFDTPKYGVLPNPWKQKSKPLIIKGNYLYQNASYNKYCEHFKNYGSP